jgi:hypothetical protein
MTANHTQPHHVVTDEEYFEALPENGLELAKQLLRDDLTRAIEDEDFPATGTVSGLTTINTIEQSKKNQASA